MADDTNLSERKLIILKAIIQNYLETGEPVGSRTLSKYTELNLSSATIRNEMADLEDLGYIFQPHTSAGRIPSDKGYRLYVDMLMEEKEQEITQREDAMLEKADKVEKVLQQAAKVLASQYELRDHGVGAGQQPEYAEVHPALAGRCGTGCGGDRSRRQCDQE